MAKKFRITAPDGKILEITGPDDATPEQAMAQAQQMYQVAGPDVDLNHLFPTPTASTAPQSDDRSASAVAVDQALNVGKGALGVITGIPGMLKEAAGIGYDAVTGNEKSAADRTKNLVSGAVHSITDPVATVARGAGAYVAPNSVAPPSRQDWDKAAQDSGSLAGTLALGEAVKSVPTSAEGIQGVANKLRSIRKVQAPGVPLTTMQAVKAGIGAAASPAADIAERLARARAGMDVAPTYANVPGELPPSGPTLEPTPEMVQQAAPVQYNFPPTPEGAPAAATIEPTPAVQRLTVAGEMPGLKAPVTSSAPIEPTPELQQLNMPGEMPGLKAPATPSAPIEPTPELQQMQQPAQFNMPPTPEATPSPATIEMPQQPVPPVAHPDASVAPTPQHIQMAREAILQNGSPRSTANLLKVSRIVPDLLKTVPELKGIPPGASFNTRLFNAFNNIGHELNATEASISDTTTVPTEDAVKQLKDLEAKYLDTNQPNAVRSIDKVKSFLEEKPSMSWSEFIKAKRAFFNEIKLSSAPGRDAYQIFKKLSNDVSPELGALNQKYYVVKSAIESAAMDVRTGEKIRTIGKGSKPIGTDTGKGTLRMPL